ncbi:MAG: signal peptidase I [Mogibacterium sp.]|nr:signal peptidase I [Mogibacterium sp.]
MSRVERNQSEYGKAEKSGGAGSFLGRLLSAIGTLTMILMIAMGLVVAVPHLIGYSQYVVVSGSMEPAIPVGSIVMSKPVEPAELEVGDVIVFYTEKHIDTPVTHRVVENRIDEREVITKGDANSSNDLSPVFYENIEGKVLHHIPRIGFVVGLFGTTLGKISALMIIVAGYLLTLIGSNFSKNNQAESQTADVYRRRERST